jgi:hypothetical protein
MADKKITELTPITGANLDDADEFVVVDASADETKSVTRTQFFKKVPDVSFGDNDKAIFGTGSDLQIYHDGSHSVIKEAGTGNLQFYADTRYQFFNADGSSSYAQFVGDGGAGTEYVQLRYGDSPVLETTATGIDVTGTITSDGLTAAGDLLVGKTSEDESTEGGQIQSNGVASFTSSGTSPLRVDRTVSDGNIVIFRKDGTTVGNISVTGSATAYNTSSDYRLKEDWVPMSGASERVQALKPVNFAWKVDASRVDGFLAHELAEVIPEAVSGSKDAMQDEEHEVTPAVLDEDGNETSPAVMDTRSVPDMQGIDQSKIVPLLTAALQEALTKIADLEARLTALEV